jgi:phospholipid/cholesterol/gamma-HCH transport system ATP-binding protein
MESTASLVAENKLIENQPAAIYIRELYKSFDDNKVLQGINFDVCKGENVVILGRSGSGKSVLIKIIAGLLKPDKGIIKVLGKDITRLNKKQLKELRLNIGFIFQAGALYDSMTVKKNLEFSLIRGHKNLNEKQVNSEIESVLDAVGLLQTINQLPAELSGGQKKRIAIARTLILKPEIMLYDEPTGGLDPTTSIEINNLINDVREKYNTSSIIITHDLTCAKTTGDRIFMLYDGKFIREGTFEEVFKTNDPRIRSFYDYNFTE